MLLEAERRKPVANEETTVQRQRMKDTRHPQGKTGNKYLISLDLRLLGTGGAGALTKEGMFYLKAFIVIKSMHIY